MFNQYIVNDDMTEDTLLLATIRMNIEFALVSARCIINSPNYDEEVYGTRYVYYFFHLQSLLTACGNITSAFLAPNLILQSTRIHDDMMAAFTDGLRNLQEGSETNME